MKIFKNIKFRLLSGLFLFLFVVFYGFGYILIDSFKQAYYQSIQNSLTTVAKDLKHEFNIYLNNAGEFEDIKHEFDMDILYAQIILIQNNKTTILVKSSDLKSFNLDFDKNNTFSNLSSDNIVFSVQQIPKLTPKNIKVATALLEQTNDSKTILLVAIPFNKYTPFVENMKVFLWFGLLALLGIILVAVYFVLSKSLLATKSVVDEVKNIKIDGNLHSIKPTHISNEIDELIETFNMLIDDLQSSYKKVKDFGQNASHELKTPLTIMRGEIEVGLRKDRSNEEYKEILTSTLSELNFLEDTIEKILFLSNSKDSYIVQTFEEIYIDEILSEIISEKKAFAITKNIELKLLLLEPLSQIGNQTLLKIAINNLIDNAIKYSNPNSVINVSLTSNELIVEDFGCGIPQNEIDKIFDRFYRVDKVRSQRSGSGLGLSIVKTILELHGFTILIDSMEDKYTKATILFSNEV